MKYRISEFFESIQGEGMFTGLPVIFVRFSGCNMSCPFCDTDFETRVNCTPEELFGHITQCGPTRDVVFTGGEPLLQDLTPIIEYLKSAGYRVHLETNGTIEPDSHLAFHSISLSPKVHARAVKVKAATSLKVLFPYIRYHGFFITAEEYNDFPAQHKTLQLVFNDKGTFERKHLDECSSELRRLGNGWKLGLQIHKLINIV